MCRRDKKGYPKLKLRQKKECKCASSRLFIENDLYSNNLEDNDIFERNYDRRCKFNKEYIKPGDTGPQLKKVCAELKCSEKGFLKLRKMENCQCKSK